MFIEHVSLMNCILQVIIYEILLEVISFMVKELVKCLHRWFRNFLFRESILQSMQI